MKVLKSVKPRRRFLRFRYLGLAEPQFSLGVNFYELPIALIEFCNIYFYYAPLRLRNCCEKCTNFTFLFPARVKQGVFLADHTTISNCSWVYGL